MVFFKNREPPKRFRVGTCQSWSGKGQASNCKIPSRLLPIHFFGLKIRRNINVTQPGGFPAPGKTYEWEKYMKEGSRERRKEFKAIEVDERTALLASIVDSSDDAIIGKTLEGMITAWNPAAESMYGYTAQETLGKPVSILIPPDRQKETDEILAQIRKGKRVEHCETLRRRKDGTLVYVSLTVSPIHDRSGKLVGASSVARDISERKRIDDQLQATSKYARSLIEASLDPLVTISPEGKITDVNEATVKVTGILRDRLIGTDFSDYFTEPEKARQGYRQVFQKGFVTDYPLTIRHRDGKLVDVLYNASV